MAEKMRSFHWVTQDGLGRESGGEQPTAQSGCRRDSERRRRLRETLLSAKLGHTCWRCVPLRPSALDRADAHFGAV